MHDGLDLLCLVSLVIFEVSTAFPYYIIKPRKHHRISSLKSERFRLTPYHYHVNSSMPTSCYYPGPLDPNNP